MTPQELRERTRQFCPPGSEILSDAAARRRGSGAGWATPTGRKLRRPRIIAPQDERGRGPSSRPESESSSKRSRWAWQAFAVSGVVGFLSFLAYLGYGYLDTWHGAGTLALLPCFIVGLALSSRLAIREPRPWLKTDPRAPAALRAGRWLLLATAGGLVAAGGTILVVGMTSVFVPQDLTFMRLHREALGEISPRLIPLIAHDRAGFGGGLMSTGLVIAFCAWYAQPSRAFRQAHDVVPFSRCSWSRVGHIPSNSFWTGI